MADKPKMNTRQRIILVVLVLVIIVIGYMIFGGGEKPSVQQTPVKQTVMSNTKPAMAASAPTAQTPSAVPGNPPAVSMTPPGQDVAQLKPAVIPKNPELLKLQETSQEKYINALNELQMLKVQRDIAENSQAIAAAKLATVTAEKNINDLLTRPVLPGGDQAAPQRQATPYLTEIPYSVVSVAWAGGQWHAVLSYQGKNYSVCRGDTLPVDGSVVALITRDGVVLKRDTVTRKLNIVSTI